METVGLLPLVEIIRGDDFTETLTFEYTDIVEDNQGVEYEVDLPYDITVYDNIVMDVRRKSKEDSDIVMTLELGSGLTVTNTNKLIIHIDHINSNKFTGDYYQFASPLTPLQQTKYYYRDIRFIKEGVVTTLLKGTYKVKHNITKIDAL